VGAIWNTSVAPILYSSVAAILLLGPAHLSGRMSPAFPATSGRCQDVSWRSRSELVPSAPCLTKSSNRFFCSTLATPFSLMLFPFFVYMQAFAVNAFKEVMEYGSFSLKPASYLPWNME